MFCTLHHWLTTTAKSSKVDGEGGERGKVCVVSAQSSKRIDGMRQRQNPARFYVHTKENARKFVTKIEKFFGRLFSKWILG